MGKGVAAKLAEWLGSGKAPGYSGPLVVYNRTTATAQGFAHETPGVTAVATVAEVVPAKIVFSLLANDAAADAVLGDYLSARAADGASHPAIYVNAATLLPATVKRQAAAAAKAGVEFVNMSVFGRPDAAATGSLVAVPAGPAAARQALAPLLPAFAGRGVWDLGEDPATSASFKLIGNFWISSQIEVAAECLALGAKNGIEDSAVLTMLETFLPSPIPIGYARRMAAGDYSTETGFAIDLALKDLGHIRALAADSACPLPLADVAYNHLLQTKARHGGSLDWGAMFLAVRDNCGLPSNSKQE